MLVEHDSADVSVSDSSGGDRRLDAPGSNLAAVTTQAAADRLNATFYARIQYPPAPQAFERVTDPGFWSRMLAQDVGSWHEPVVGSGSEVWVAGCGRNQALITALKFPQASVLGSDLSETSLGVCQAHALQVGAANLQLRRESINDVSYGERFDYVVCTGVIHHNADPEVALRRLARSLRPRGVLELMVYNQFHRLNSAAFQRAIRTWLGDAAAVDIDREAALARQLLDDAGGAQRLAAIGRQFRAADFAYFADALLQPIEHSFTVASLSDMAEQCGLELLAFVVDHFSRAQSAIDWNLAFTDPALKARYEALPDVTRWQITNYLLMEQSPMLWFYLQRRDSPRRRRSEQAMAADFMNLRVRRNRTEREMFVQREDGSYGPPSVSAFPKMPIDPVAARVFNACDEGLPMSEAMRSVGLDTSFRTVHRLRVRLATTAYPFLTAIQP